MHNVSPEAKVHPLDNFELSCYNRIMKTKRCTQCGQEKPLSKFYPERPLKDGTLTYRANCKQCVMENAHKWREKHPQQRKETALRHYRKRRLQALLHYSNGTLRCACCGEDKIEFLAIDHINDDGAEHRRQVGKTRALFQWLKTNGYPDGFQVLCHNCNWAKSAYGQCPHEAEHNGTYQLPDIEAILHWRKPVRRRLLTYRGRTMSITEWAKETGISRSAIALRLDRYGWPIHDALTKPARKRKESQD